MQNCTAKLSFALYSSYLFQHAFFDDGFVVQASVIYDILVDLRGNLEMLQFWHGFIVIVVLQQQASLHDLTETAKNYVRRLSWIQHYPASKRRVARGYG